MKFASFLGTLHWPTGGDDLGQHNTANQYAGPGSLIRWRSDNEPLFGTQNSPKLIAILSLGNSVELKVRRRAPGKVPSLIRLDHGDVLVMDGLDQSEYEHCTASGRQGPRVNLTYRWVAQHTASCPLAGVVGCVLPTRAKGLVEPSSRWLGEGENKWVLFLGIGPPFVNPGDCSSGQHLDSHEGASSQCSASILLGGARPLSGRARWVGGRRWALSRRRQYSKKMSFYSPFVFFFERKLYSFFLRVWFCLFVHC